MRTYFNLAFVSALALLLLMGSAARAEERLRDVEGAPGGLALHPWLEYSIHDHTHANAQPFMSALPADTSTFSLITVHWPRSDQACRLAIIQHGIPYGGTGQPETLMMIQVDEEEPQLLTLPQAAVADGILSRLCIWPTSRDTGAELVFLSAFSTREQDSVVFGFTLTPAGELSYLDLGGALTLYGWFNMVDLDSDGSFELITSRNLDGAWGGFFYHTVRSFDGTGYAAAPDSFPDYFQAELAWLDWIIEMRSKIQDDPAGYINQTGIGPNYLAEYNGTRYGFDSIIELPATVLGIEDLPAYNTARREAFKLVSTYRGELRTWLDGGEYPATWKLTQ